MLKAGIEWENRMTRSWELYGFGNDPRLSYKIRRSQGIFLHTNFSCNDWVLILCGNWTGVILINSFIAIEVFPQWTELCIARLCRDWLNSATVSSRLPYSTYSIEKALLILAAGKSYLSGLVRGRNILVGKRKK